MGEKTGISWCDHTFNPWIGCEKVSAGCLNCYAERENARFNWVGKWNNRMRTSPANWKKPLAWAKNAHIQGVTRRVFCGSLCDVLDHKVPHYWRHDLYELIQQCESRYPGALEWLLLTKRIENAMEFLPRSWVMDPPTFIRLGVTAENQEMADKRIPELLRVWRGKNFISVEPMLSAVDLFSHPGEEEPVSPYPNKIDWVICGGESGPGARPMHPDWVRSLRDQCQSADVPFFFKSWGEWAEFGSDLAPDAKPVYTPTCKNFDFDDGTMMFFVGKARAGRILDGRTWEEFPK